jgi:hypothetical protein
VPTLIRSIAGERLRRQSIAGPPRRTAEGVVSWLGAVQAQEYAAAKWGLGLRMPGTITDARIEDAFNAGRILRTHVMRPTWHFVTPLDIRWMLELTGPRVQRLMQVYNRRLELDPPTLGRAATIAERALGEHRYLTRAELSEHLARGGIAAKGQRLAHVMLHAELEAVVCSGPRRGRHSTYALLAERAPRARRLERDEALAKLARRYFRSHGPATLRDFVWWSGLLTLDAKCGVEMIRARREVHDGLTYWWVGEPDEPADRRRVHLLPIYDEYFVAYRDRRGINYQWTASQASSFAHPFVVDGHLAGTWRPVRRADVIRIDVWPGGKLTRIARRELEEAAGRYGKFLAAPVQLAVEGA